MSRRPAALVAGIALATALAVTPATATDPIPDPVGIGRIAIGSVQPVFAPEIGRAHV